MFLCPCAQVLGQLLLLTVEQVDSKCIDTFIVAPAQFSAWLWCCKCEKEHRKKLGVVVFLLKELLQCKE